MRKVFALMLLLSLITTLTGCVDSERYWTLPLEDGFEVWCENGERMLVRETDTFRYAFVVRGIGALRVEENFILTCGGESYTFVETATGAVARTASGEDGFRAACEALGLDADGAWTALDSRPEAAVDAWHHLYDAITPRELAAVASAFGGYVEGELPTPRSGLYMNSHGGFHGDGDTFAELYFAPEDGKAVERLLEDSGWPPLPATGAAASYMGDRLPGEICSMDGVGPVMPEVENGWWRFADTTPGDYGYIANFVLWMYDADAAALYYWEHDT